MEKQQQISTLIVYFLLFKQLDQTHPQTTGVEPEPDYTPAPIYHEPVFVLCEYEASLHRFSLLTSVSNCPRFHTLQLISMAR